MNGNQDKKIENSANKPKEELGKSGYIWKSLLRSKTSDRVTLVGTVIMISQGKVYSRRSLKNIINYLSRIEIQTG
jgi:hypothetical protein